MIVVIASDENTSPPFGDKKDLVLKSKSVADTRRNGEIRFTTRLASSAAASQLRRQPAPTVPEPLSPGPGLGAQPAR